MKSFFSHVSMSQNHMATTFVLTLSVEKSRQTAALETLKEAHKLIRQLEKELSEFLVESPVYRFNHLQVGERVFFPKSATELLKRSLLESSKTQNAFDPFVKSRSQSSLARIGMIENADGTAWVEKRVSGTCISFGAIGKGFALDQVRTILERDGFNDYLLNAGGSSIILSGFSAPGDPWCWAWEEKVFHHPAGNVVAVGVSGRDEKGNHLIDPSSKEALKRGKSVVVYSSSATTSDALSTAFFVLGKPRAEEIIASGPLTIFAEWKGF